MFGSMDSGMPKTCSVSVSGHQNMHKQEVSVVALWLL